jgi:hypothetical protein
MYLAALAAENLYVSTYFIATADGVGGGGPPQKSPRQKTQAKKQRQQTLIVGKVSQPFLV